MKDIKQIPFEEIYQAYKSISSTRVKEYQTLANSKADLDRVKKLSSFGESRDSTLIPLREGDVEVDPTILEDLRTESKTLAVELFVKEHALEHSWFPFQLINHFGSWTPILGSDGLYDSVLTRGANVKTDYDIGLYILATGSISPLFKTCPKEYKQYNSPISPLVPIILAGMKQNKDIKYSQWSREGIAGLVYKPLAEAMTCVVPALLGSEIAEIRRIALTDNTGKRAGIMNNPATSTKLNRIGESPLKDLPKLAKYMVLQTWCAHPSNRNKNAILDPSSWDDVPNAVINVEPITKTKPFFEGGLSPW